MTAPSTKDCLGEEAQQALEKRIPEESTIYLDEVTETERVKTNVRGVVRAANGSNVAIGVVEAGLAALDAGGDRGSNKQLSQAATTARERALGLLSEDVSCTLPAQVAAVWCGTKVVAATATTSASTPASTTSTRTSPTTETVSACYRAGDDDEDRAHTLLAAAIALKGLMAKDDDSVAWLVLDKKRQSLLVQRTDKAIAQHTARIAEHDRARAAASSRSAASRSSVESRQSAEAEAVRVAAEKAEQERLAAERAEDERLAAEQAERDRLVAEQAERDRLAAEQAERDRLVAEQAESDRVAAEQAESDRVAAEEAERAQAAADAAEREAAEQAQEDSSGGGDGGYTGPRCYDPGGKTWHPC